MRTRYLSAILLACLVSVSCDDNGPASLGLQDKTNRPAARVPSLKLLEPSNLEFSSFADEPSMETGPRHSETVLSALGAFSNEAKGSSGWRPTESRLTPGTRTPSDSAAELSREVAAARAFEAWAKPVTLTTAAPGKATFVRVHVDMSDRPDTIQLSPSTSTVEYLHVALKAVARLRTRRELAGKTITVSLHNPSKESLPRSWSSYLDFKLTELRSKAVPLASVEIRALERK